MASEPAPAPTRRSMLAQATAAAACAGCAMAAVPVVSYLVPKPGKKLTGPVAVAKTTDIPKGGAIKVKVGALLVMLIRHQGKLIALDAKCTHLGCPVEWDAEDKRVRCPCHAGVFTPEGKYVSGPPPADQPSIETKVKGDRIFLVF